MKQNRNVDKNVARNVDRKRQIHRNSKSHTRTVGEAIEQQSSQQSIPIQTNVNNILSIPMQRSVTNNIKTVTERANVLNNNTAPLPETVSVSNIGAYVNQIDIIRSIINLESITSNISQNFTFIDGGGSGDKIIINNIWKDDNNEYADKEWVLEQIANAGGGGGVNLSDYIKFGENTSLSTVIIKSPDNNDNNLQMNNHTFMLNRENNLNLKLTLNEAEREARIFTGNTLYLRAETLKFNTANDSIMFHYDYQTCEMRSNDFVFRTNISNTELLKINDNTITYKGQPIISTGGGSVDLTGYIHMGSNVITTPIQLITGTKEVTNENIYITGDSIRYHTPKALDGEWSISGLANPPADILSPSGTYCKLSAPRILFNIYGDFIIGDYENNNTILYVSNDTITWKGQSLINNGGTTDLSNYIQFGTNVAASSTAAVSISHNNEITTTTPQKLEINDGSGNYMRIDRQSISVYADSNKSFDIYANPSNKGMNIETSTLTVESPEVEFHCDTIGIYHGTKVYPTCEITDDSFIIDRATLIMQLGTGTRYLQINNKTFEWGGYAMLHEGANTNINSVKLYANTNNTGKCLELKPDGVTITSENSRQLSVSVGTLSINSDFSEYDFQLSTNLFTFNLSNNFNVNLPNNTATFNATDFNVKTPSFKISYDTSDKSTTIFEVNNDTITYKGQPIIGTGGGTVDLSNYIHGGTNTNISDITVYKTNADTINGAYYSISPNGISFHPSYGNRFDVNCNNSMEINSQNKALNIYFNTVNIASTSNGNISLISNSFGGNTKYSINLTATGIVSIFNNEFLLTKNTQNDSSNPYFKVTPDTIEWNGRPVIGTGGGGSVDLSNYIQFGTNIASDSTTDISILYNNDIISIAPQKLKINSNSRNILTITAQSIRYNTIEDDSGNSIWYIQYVSIIGGPTDIGELTNRPFLNIVTQNILFNCHNGEFVICDSWNKTLLRINGNTITYKGQSLLVDTNNFIINGENTNKSVTFKGSNNNYVTIDSNVIEIARTTTSSIFKIEYTTSNDTATCNMNINNMSCNVNDLLFINCRDNLQIRCGTAFVLNASTADGVRLSTIPDFIINGTVSFNFNMNDDTNSIRFTQNQVDGNYNKKNFGFARSGENDGRIYVFYSERDSAVNRFSIRNFDEINFILSNATNAHDPGIEAHTWSFKTDNLYYGVNPYVSKSFTVTHISPIDENYTYDDFTIGLPVYMSGKVYVKDYENKIWKLSTRNDTIDCISSIKPTGTLKEYLGICVSKETDEITFASHGDFLVKVGDSSKYEIGDIIYINDNINNSISISVLDENTPLTAKINKAIIGTVTSIIDSEFVAVFRD